MDKGASGFMLAAPASGSGKTAAACGLMAALRGRGLAVRACKCGPDYIDPMFHREVLGLDSLNLDLFFSDPESLRQNFAHHAAGADVTVVEGVMGYYDGMGLDTDQGSSYDVASVLGLPVILVVPARGAALSLAATVLGIIGFRKQTNIRGILLNRVSAMLYPRLKKMLEEELKKAGHEIPVIGYLPENPAFRFESRHLGLITPQEIEGLKEQTAQAGRILTETVDLELILRIAGEAERTDRVDKGTEAEEERKETRRSLPRTEGKNRLRIGIARDRAFCFYYKDNLELLERLGCELVPFSPLADAHLPDGISGLLIGGGYPELYGETLSRNTGLLTEIHDRIGEGMPCLAECGGFMYLHEEMTDRDGNVWKLAGTVRGKTWPADRLVRFGYVRIKAPQAPGGDSVSGRADSYLLPGEEIRAHEFHYWDSSDNGNDCLAVKPDGRRSWQCIHMEGNLFAGYPHLYLPSLPAFAERFIQRCRNWRKRK